MHDIVIRNGSVVDGTGAPARLADVAIDRGRITTVGRVDDAGAEEIDATGMVVTPGFVDIHTHYDGQVTWDPTLSPTSWHGVTTLVMGNCGVGFAPVEPERREWLIGLMEGVEDIPGTALHEGIRWSWETFPEYLDAIDTMPLALDVAALAPHGAIRSYVMGERGARNEPATSDDIAAIAAIVSEAIAAGAVGVSTSRTILHKAVDGEPVPGTFAAEDELFAMGRALAEAGRGVFELAPAGIQGEDMSAPDTEVSWMRRLAAETGRPITFGFLQHDIAPNDWRRLLDIIGAASADGVPLRPQITGRPIGMLLGLQGFNPFRLRPTMMALAERPLADLVAELHKPSVRRQILGEDDLVPLPAYIGMGRDRIFPLGDPPDYEPAPETSVAAIAARTGVDADDLMYDMLLRRDGRELLLRPLVGYSDLTLDPVREMLLDESTVLGVGDGGAHVRVICDASTPTSMLTLWVRDRTRGATLPIETVIHKMTKNNADLYGFADRGVLAPGKRADINVIDMRRLTLHAPEFRNDLPGGAARLVQESEGYVATLVAGTVTRRNDADTGARPGSLVRSR
ncbi:MAG: N-acyl-D-aspartate/D-glutamate deacylase [Ilumatobacteraceae bacterium]|nr:N-acyl-D-aspartate/D-glutamate deacylase [Ilumatobacteraceae bacterium]